MAFPNEEELTRMTEEADGQSSRAVQRWADASMYEAEPMEDPGKIRVHLLWMTPDPLGALAAACRMYEGKPTLSMDQIEPGERQHYAEQVQKTHLKAPLEFIKFHFFIEGVTRSFTHQMVRQRTAVYAQESLRFAVKENFAAEVALPPSLAELPAHHPTRQKWDEHMQQVEAFYKYLIANDVPAEDAREVLPHATTTRLNYATDLRALSDHAGNRLCTQAQLQWRDVFNKIVEAIRTHPAAEGAKSSGADLVEMPLFKPVCYQLGHCPFQASFDRGCTIRSRVEAYSRHGVPSSVWPQGFWIDDPAGGGKRIDPISDDEWMFDRKAAFQ